MVNSTSANGDTQLKSTARYSLRKRPGYSPTSNHLRKKKRVYRTRGGTVSLRKIPDESVSIVESNSQVSLLHLPGELRTEKYKYALCGMHIVHGDFRGYSTWAAVVHTTSGVSVS
ncbi:hypothetical protein AA0119_g11079 [Alternaria tenuissima]|uniref:Uncharacterized protein n=2 Tax=Alternaria alternata complex TaxID=187734 RepID=A0A4V1WR15_ALTAL|nr:hypothetical protein AA0115_g5578 [Alternaria tenuissima]RYN72349.1 hypothetical protein AA0117_g8651 [Alternaria alternata]RYN90243.1 hypothetical protein AA0119_g11079 [Alternaria tenuissima]RYO06927.1 hypothetical protein AA0121_g11980 [Alternaria tenuissima]RYO62333.1 hypothetical protein AA0116_g5118 [Alternaria tenuissima]